MTAPRRILPNTTYLVTRRCSRREFLLRPCETTTAIFGFLLAVAAQRYRMHVHAFCVMSNHYHLVVTDTDATLPAFHQYLDSLVARATNASLGRWDSFWERGSYSAVELVSREAIVAEVAYVLANPVKAKLVRSGKEWPGLWSAPEQFGNVLQFERPAGFFSPSGALPATASLELTIPPGFASVAEFVGEVTTALSERQADARGGHDADFAGVARVLAQSPLGRPTSFERRRGLNPRVASRDKRSRIEALRALKEFMGAYRRAWIARRAGDLAAVFPPGTYLLRVMHAVPCGALA